MKKYSVDFIRKSKNSEIIAAITAYDYLFAKLFDGEVEIILVGDSLNMSFGGHKDTLSIGLDEMIYHSKAVSRAIEKSLLIVDMPFGTYQDEKEALKNATKILKESSCDGVKIEGGIEKAEIVRHLTQNGIAVMGHIGLRPQFVRSEGGYKIRGKDESDTISLLKDAKALEEAGAFSIILEGIKKDAAKTITDGITIPTIGIGAGNQTDGQIIVWSDMLGIFEDFKPKFVRRYLEGATLIKGSLKEYVNDVKSRNFPSENESY